MKKTLFTSLFLLMLLASLVSTAAAAPLASKTAALVSAEYGYKGPVLTFVVTGKFSKAELKGSLHVEGGADYGLHCTQVDETTVTCTTSKKVAGVNVVATWGGFVFWAFVPDAPAAQYCYSIWDWWEFTNNQWTDFGPYCQDAAAAQGDVITYTVPDPNGSYNSWVEFYEDDVTDYCPSPVPYYGPAYYYPNCPEILE